MVAARFAGQLRPWDPDDERWPSAPSVKGWTPPAKPEGQHHPVDRDVVPKPRVRAYRWTDEPIPHRYHRCRPYLLPVEIPAEEGEYNIRWKPLIMGVPGQEGAPDRIIGYCGCGADREVTAQGKPVRELGEDGVARGEWRNRNCRREDRKIAEGGRVDLLNIIAWILGVVILIGILMWIGLGNLVADSIMR